MEYLDLILNKKNEISFHELLRVQGWVFQSFSSPRGWLPTRALGGT